MKKNFSVNIGKRLFNIDEDAFDCLGNYMNRLRSFFSSGSGSEEILTDIEMRIAELLIQKTESGGQDIVTKEHVEEVIKEMGEPTQFSESDDSTNYASSGARTTGKLFRDPVNRKVGGVAAGLSAFFGINPFWIRLIFVLATFLYGSGPVIYLILWLILPEAQTTSEKLEMQRQNVNISTLRNELASAGIGIQKTGNSFLESFGVFLRNTIDISARLIRWFFQLFGRLLGLFMLFLVVISYFGLALAFLVRDNPGIGGYKFDSITLYQMFQWMIPGTSDRWLFYIASLLLLISLTGLLIYGGLRLLLKWPPLRWPVMIAFLLIFFAGLLTTGSAIFRYSASTNVSGSLNEIKPMKYPSRQLHIQSGPWDVENFLNPLSGSLKGDADSEALGEINLSFRPAPGDSLICTLIKSASSSNRLLSERIASNIFYDWQIKDTLLTLNPYYRIPFNDGMHYQELNVVVGIPVNKEIYIDPAISWKIRYSDFYDAENDGGMYKMTTSGLTRLKPEVSEADSTGVTR